MKKANLLTAVFALALMACNTTNQRFNKDEISSDCPIKDLLTEVPALDEKSIDSAILENETLKAVFDKNTGRLVSFINKNTGWQIQRRGYLSRSFRLAVPMPGRRDNCVYGENQILKKFEISNDKKAMTFTWDRLKTSCDRELDIEFKGIVKITSNGLEFTAEVNNNSDLTVEVVYWPYLGDLGLPQKQRNIAWMYYNYAGGLNKSSLYPYFTNHKGYYGDDYPLQIFNTTYSRFGLLGNDKEGLYVLFNDTADKYLLNYTFELKPGYEYSESMGAGIFPDKDSLSGKPLHIEFGCVHFTYINPSESYSLQPVVMQPYSGDWHAGADFYKDWRKTWYKKLPAPEWTAKVHSWMQFHINSAEDYPRCKYKDLIEYAKECSKYNVKAIQLTGWNIGGQDRGNPMHDIDPRLGTWQELKDAIAECKKLGVEIILFNKYTWADESQPWFKKELVKYSVKDPYGNYYNSTAYQYQTIMQFNNINTRRLIPMCVLSPEWRKVAENEFKKSIELGAAGMLYDECQHHSPAIYCFDKNHGHHVPAYIYRGDKMLEDGFRRISKEMNPEYVFAGESCTDLQFRSYDISYFRINRNFTPMQRYAAPEINLMAAVIGFNDRNTINQCLLYRFIISYEPRNFKGKLSEFPLTMKYGGKVDSLRTKYSDFLWYGEFMHTVGAKVMVKDNLPLDYSVFIQPATGKKAVVVSNPSYNQAINVEVKTDDYKGTFLMASPEDNVAKESNGTANIPALSAVVFMEK